MSYNLAKGESVSLSALAHKTDESSYDRIEAMRYRKVVAAARANDPVALHTLIKLSA